MLLLASTAHLGYECMDGVERELMGKVTRMKLQYFGHVTRGSAGYLALTVLEDSVDGLPHQGRPKRQWMVDIDEWSGTTPLVISFS